MLSKRERHLSDLRHLTAGSSKFVTYLLDQSNLPGKRGNLELAFAFAEYIEEQYPVNPERAWTFCEALVTENPPQNNFTGAEEFLPFCGVLGLGRIGRTDPVRESDALIYVKSAARDALELHKAILENVAHEPDRRDPDYMVLVKGLCYTLSVVIPGIEQEGFAYLEDLLATDHPILQKIVRENLKKKRLIRLNAGKVAGLQQKLSSAN